MQRFLLSLMMMVAIVLVASAQTTPPFAANPSTIVYDQFDQKWLNPSKWLPTAACTPFSDSSETFSVMECVRAIEEGKLRLEVKTWGDRSSNATRQYGDSELHFARPNAVRSIRTTVNVKSTHAAACLANPNTSTSQAIFGGNFFNTGTGAPADDMVGLFIFERNPGYGDPSTTVHGLALVLSSSFCCGYYDFGIFLIGQPIVAKLKWDKPNHQFIASTTTANGSIQAVMPYPTADTVPPAAPSKFLGARAFVPNCTDQTTTGDMEAYFDDVVVNE